MEGVAIEYSRVIQMGQVQSQADPEQDTVFVHEIAHQWFHRSDRERFGERIFPGRRFCRFFQGVFCREAGDKLNGFRSIQFDVSPMELAIASNNDEVGIWLVRFITIKAAKRFTNCTGPLAK